MKIVIAYKVSIDVFLHKKMYNAMQIKIIISVGGTSLHYAIVVVVTLNTKILITTPELIYYRAV